MADSLPGCRRRDLFQSREGLRRIQKIVEDLRDFAHLEVADRQEADLNNGIRLTIGLMRCLADARCVSLETDLSPLPRLVCFPAKLNLVVQNLVSNAIDACRPGGRVIVRTRLGIGYLEIEVDDTGCGIDPAIRDKVFDPFFATKPIGQGTGLGRVTESSRNTRGRLNSSQYPAREPSSSFGCRCPPLVNWPRSWIREDIEQRPVAMIDDGNFKIHLAIG